MGLMAILFWSTTVAVARSAVDSFGALNLACLTSFAGGALLLLWEFIRGYRLRRVLAGSRRYLLVCGTLFSVYLTCIYGAVGLAESDEAIVTVGLLNYLWTALVLVFAIPVLGYRAKGSLFPGIGMALLGVLCAEAAISDGGFASLLSGLADNWLAYCLAALAAVFWALYTNLARKLAPDPSVNGVPLFLIIAGLVIGLLCVIWPQQMSLTPRAYWEAGYISLVITALAYAFWDVAIRRGNFLLVGAAAYLVPLLSSLASVWYLDISPGWLLWPGCLLIIAGAIVCKRSMIRT